jgi:hypothetical protein
MNSLNANGLLAIKYSLEYSILTLSTQMMSNAIPANKQSLKRTDRFAERGQEEISDSSNSPQAW